MEKGSFDTASKVPARSGPLVSLFGVGLCPARERLSSGVLRRTRLLPPPLRRRHCHCHCRQSADDRRTLTLGSSTSVLQLQQQSLKALSIRPKESSRRHTRRFVPPLLKTPGRTLSAPTPP